ncbi:uncharacterized protein [Neodiprion pinetum]|uniref:uncharacterized protein LOC124184505 n=1 Tax=Neodiprion fabricii TaxID=2872261 RepID=UPI001ED8F38C|nr:uncharacterized protein LOC124184505 [Neodiprion fabricii]XP_046430235.1 uncharacterized protein LOC124184505 [Neodiprion fabricii]XP_046430236.1 uncharacterized protein LOC124184505 [Neodiprion fabricii]XP_046430237.1 uncharacterized protein LOC124184505 [Neodiprion fabricii]XP_046487342.1 uncharacterized protein LOC124221410 [Neodiprion pinetum]XP_046487343.1 uncharacterized protein LOC124221410 [Neodiprion pinetum]XP_046487344.1 uncharacterized protein LOC124221410 [Neodiprion pinetum]
MPSATHTPFSQGMGSVGSNATGTTGPSATTMGSPKVASVPEPPPTLSEREQLKIEFYKTYDVMTGVRIAATLGGFFGLMVILVVYKSRCKSSKQLEDPQLTAAAAAAVAEAEAEERALAAALEAIARLPPRPDRGPRRSLCVEASSSRAAAVPRFASVGGGGGYDALLAPPMRHPRLAISGDHRRCSSVTCSSTASSYLERRGSAMTMPCLPPPSRFPRHAAYDEPWDLYYPIDIQVIQPTPDMSPCGSEAGLYAGAMGMGPPGRRAPLASMGSVDPPDPDSRSLGSDSVFLGEEELDVMREDCECLDTEDEVSGFSTDSDTPGPSCRRFLRVPPRRRQLPERWDGAAGCVPRRRASAPPRPCRTCLTISASVETPRSPPTASTTSSSNSTESPPHTPPIELRHRPPVTLPSAPPAWSQETLF